MKLTSYRANIYFDIYESPSIKYVKRTDRGDEDTGPLFSSFKREILQFLYKEIQNINYTPIIANKVFYCAVNNQCEKIFCGGGSYRRLPNYTGVTRVVFHAKYADTYDPGNKVVRANNTDIANILAYNVNYFQNSTMWYDSGNDSNNSRKLTNIHRLTEILQNIESLPGFYSFTGNDYTLASYN